MSDYSSMVVLVREVAVLLQAARADLNSELSRRLGPSLDEAIEKLEKCLCDGRDTHGVAVDVLKVLAQGLAALPAIMSLIELMKDK
jgi:hypothetical protein